MHRVILALMLTVGWICLASADRALAAGNAPGIPAGYRLLYSQDFEKPEAIKDFEFTDASKWRLTDKDGNHVLECLGTGKYTAKVRSPNTIALLSNRVFGDLILEARLLQTGREYGHRDMCVFFGFTDPSKFYYAHMATKADPNAHNIFIVNDAPRKNIATKTTAGINWGQEQWHTVRLVRTVGDGTIKLYFNDMTEPIMVAQDKTFGPGYVGFGSFDDAGMIDDVRIWGPEVQEKQSKFFEKAR